MESERAEAIRGQPMSTARQKAQPRRRATADTASTAPPEPDLRTAQKLVLALMAIPGRSGEEGQVRAFIIERLRGAGAPSSAIRSDQAQRHTPLAGQVGNLVLRLPGTRRGPRRLLMAHMDTVPLCVGSKPVVRGQFVRSAARQTGLGADDRAGCAVILTAACEILQRRLPHPPLVFLWPVQEEVGLFGARACEPGAVGPTEAGVQLGRRIGRKTHDRCHRRLSHPHRRRGNRQPCRRCARNRASAPSRSPAWRSPDLQRGGWLGDVRQGEQRGTSNIGVIQGGAATNVVTDRVELKAEARSHDPVFRRAIRDAIVQAFHKAAG